VQSQNKPSAKLPSTYFLLKLVSYFISTYLLPLENNKKHFQQCAGAIATNHHAGTNRLFFAIRDHQSISACRGHNQSGFATSVVITHLGVAIFSAAACFPMSHFSATKKLEPGQF
jgi:hypothetical protein